mmetsp:Transcript_90007/g.131734  ORF Transcript_90007/g.131734 Transcript_90007/m.131734 type:complete len:132 (-) Transcript_90007:199-594(-)
MHDRVQNITAMQSGRVLAAVQWTSATATATARPRQRHSDSMMYIDTSPGAYAMQMAGKHARTRHGTYSMGVFDTWRASDAADIDRPFRTARMTSEDVDAGPTTNAPNRLKHPAQQLRVCARSTIYHTHTLL